MFPECKLKVSKGCAQNCALRAQNCFICRQELHGFAGGIYFAGLLVKCFKKGLSRQN